jgi:hypothetical protein
LVARDIEVEFVNFGKSLPQMLVPVSTPKVAKPGILENSPVGDGDGTGVRLKTCQPAVFNSVSGKHRNK